MISWKRLLGAAGVAAFLLSLPAHAQQAVVTSPSQNSSLNVSGTIAVTSTFQSVVPSAIGGRVRQGCLIQNTGSNTQYVYFGPLASATKAMSYQLSPPGAATQGGAISCSTSAGGVLQDQVVITGTSGDTFTAEYQ